MPRSSSPRGGEGVGLAKRGKGCKSMLLTDVEGTPVAAFTTAAGTSEVHAIETLVDEQLSDEPLPRVFYHKAADADWLGDALGEWDIEMICPHRKNF